MTTFNWNSRFFMLTIIESFSFVYKHLYLKLLLTFNLIWFMISTKQFLLLIEINK